MSHLVGQQQVPDLDQIFLGEDKSHVSLDVGQEPKINKPISYLKV